MRVPTQQQAMPISAVERETGLSKDTLRIWERRYGFPQPIRDDNGDRLYPSLQVDRLRMIKRLIDSGFRPGKIILCADAELQELTRACGGPAPPPEKMQELGRFISLIHKRQGPELRKLLKYQLMRVGLRQFVIELIAPLNVLVRQERMNGELEVFDEHLYNELTQGILHNAISSAHMTAQQPRVLLTSFPNEQQAIDLLMTEAILVSESVDVISLGVQLPVSAIAAAAIAHQVDIVALSFSGASPGNHLCQGLKDLRQFLPTEIVIWAGGPGTAQIRRPPESVMIAPSFTVLEKAVVDWRRHRHEEASG
ncbi:MAG TPA: MerR family transcriptional regulator [Burkholderiales bacterium]|nr:MerR family transcriptional regulator [Burkholderiales bacterium]